MVFFTRKSRLDAMVASADGLASVLVERDERIAVLEAENKRLFDEGMEMTERAYSHGELAKTCAGFGPALVDAVEQLAVVHEELRVANSDLEAFEVVTGFGRPSRDSEVTALEQLWNLPEPRKDTP